MKLTQLQCKEVICIGDGRRLGFIEDVEVEVPEGNICAIIVPGPCKALGMLGRKEDLRIPWHCIRRIGPDIVLVEANPEDCRVPRPKIPFRL
ncbi:MAG: YlmC/YmxH family sporulation protein [Oscillospiraceae bacterium]|nr:YlmC/YmxH family sporulation protein [Oscillospiraceae bacterium]